MKQLEIYKLIAKKSYLRSLRNRCYSIYYFGNYSPEVRNHAKARISIYDKEIQELNEKINKIRGLSNGTIRY